MIIKQIYIRNFGKLQEKSIKLEPGINLFEGANESGKTTIRTFIHGLLFGLPRQRGRAARNDNYKKYDPWKRNGVFGGSMLFSTGERTFRIDREFSKNSQREELVCVTDGEQLSIEQGDLQMLLGEISSSVFESTFSIGQLQCAADGDMVAALQNYILDYEISGSQQLDLKAALEYLKKKYKMIEKRIDENEQSLIQKVSEIRGQRKFLEQEIEKIREEDVYLKNIALSQKRQGRREEYQKRDDRRERIDRQKKVFGGVITLLFLFLAIVSWKIWPLNICFAFLTVGFAGFSLFHMRRKKQNRRSYAEENRENNIENGADNQSRTIFLREKLFDYRNQMEKLEQEEKELNRTLDTMRGENPELLAIKMASEQITMLAEERQKKLDTILKQKSSAILEKLTEGKYRNIHVKDKMQLGIDTGESFVAPEFLSAGTAQQIYFSFRMAAGEILCNEEKLPFLMDDVFALYDDERLEKALQWLSKSGHQILLFTCQDRERRIMKKMGIKFQYIAL